MGVGGGPASTLTHGSEEGEGGAASQPGHPAWIRGRDSGGRGVTSQVERREGKPHQLPQGPQSGERTYRQQKGYTC